MGRRACAVVTGALVGIAAACSTFSSSDTPLPAEAGADAPVLPPPPSDDASDATTSDADAGCVITQLTVGSLAQHACALRNDGTIWCWGLDSYGQVGAGTMSTVVRPSPVQVVGPVDPIQLAGGAQHTCALQRDGHVLCWGDAELGAVGGAVSPGAVPSPRAVPAIDDAVAIAAGYADTCALRKSGELWCWGFDREGEIPDADPTAPPTPITLAIAPVAVSIGGGQLCARDAAGALVCWGDDNVGQAGTTAPGDASVDDGGYAYVPPQSIRSSGVTDISAGFAHTCMVADGTLQCFGYNGSRQLGADGVGGSTPIGVAPSGVALARPSAGGAHTCAIAAGGVLWCWGDDTYGQSGSDDAGASLPRVVLDAGVLAVAAGQSFTCARFAAGAPKCWGNNSVGQLGRGATDSLRHSEAADVIGVCP